MQETGSNPIPFFRPNSLFDDSTIIRYGFESHFYRSKLNDKYLPYSIKV